MTMSIFPDVDEPLDVPPSDTTGTPGRWVLHRAGIVNVWQYDRVELRFAGGRLLLRGKNGAGKSKALEVLLPFLLDGDTRHLDATGRDRTTVKWLMTDGRPAGNHIGYVWLELRCADADGERFHTLGAGLKASSSTGGTDTWFFATDRRVGVDFTLDRAGECLSIDKLKEALGEEAITKSGREHRRRVGRHLFGLFDSARYDNLLHLLHRLRDPNIGNRVEAGELASVLSDALPPIDSGVLADAAARFDDLDSIREQVERADRTANALGQFLGVYRGYARTVLARRSTDVLDTDAARSKAARDTVRARREASDAATARAERDQELATLRSERVRRDDERVALEASDAYRAHLDLAERQRTVDALARTAEQAARHAARSSEAHAEALADIDGAEHDVDVQARASAQAAIAADGWLVAAGLDAGLLDPQPASTAGVLPSAETIADAAQRSRSTAVAAMVRGERAGELRRLAGKAATAAEAATVAEARAAESETRVEDARRLVAVRADAQAVAETEWADSVRTWARRGVAAAAGADWAPVDAVLDAERGGTWTDEVATAVAAALAQPIHQARALAAETLAVAASSEARVKSAGERLVALEQQAEARPEPAGWRDTVRDPAGGAALYELVELRDGVEPSAAAQLEAALESSGLLDAWVSADGIVVHPSTHDVVVHAHDRPLADEAASLAAVLRPADVDGCPVSADRVTSVLRAIGWGEQSDAHTWVAGDGRWALGALRGAWSKPAVEFVGAGARRATRERQLAEARDDLARCEADLAGARRAAADAESSRDALEALPRSLPATDEIRAAVRAVDVAAADLVSARHRHDTDRRAAEGTRATASRLRATVADRAAADDLPTALDDLDRIVGAVASAGAALTAHAGALANLERAVSWLATLLQRATERAAAVAADRTAADTARTEHGRAAAELAVLRDALGTTVQEVLTRHGAARHRITELDHIVIPAAESALHAAIEAATGSAARAEELERAEAAAAAALAEASDRLESAVQLDGFVLAAAGEAGPDAALGGAALAATLAPLVDGDDVVNDTLVLTRYDRLNEALAGGYDTAIDEIDGVKVVYVDDDNGRRPLAVVAAALAEEAAAARGRLAAREREVLERFLLRELADEVRSKLLDAHDLVRDTNRTLAEVRTSHGKGAHLEWRLREDVAATAAAATNLLIDRFATEGGDDRDTALRDALLALIEAERQSDPTASYEQHLRRALDYRSWHRFQVKVSDDGAPGSLRTLSNRLGLSQGEQRVLSYLALFAAASAHFQAIARDAPAAPRLLLLDDAFAKVDEPTHGELLGLLVDLDLDVVLTSERLWGCFPTVPGLEIYEAIREPGTPGVALAHFHWDGHRRTLVSV